MDETVLKGEIAAVITKLLEKPKTLGERHRRIWNEIEARHYNFDKRKNLSLSRVTLAFLGEKQANILESLTKADILDFFDRKLKKGSPERRFVAIYIHGNADDKDKVAEKIQSGEIKHDYVGFLWCLVMIKISRKISNAWKRLELALGSSRDRSQRFLYRRWDKVRSISASISSYVHPCWSHRVVLRVSLPFPSTVYVSTC